MSGPTGNLYIVDISSPTNPFLLAHFYLPSDTDVSCEPWDVAVRENYAYVSGNKWISGEWGGWFLAVVDISNPLAPSIMGFYDGPVISRTSAAMALSGNYAYLVVSENPYVDVWRDSLSIIDISDPTDPTGVGCYFSSEDYAAITDSKGEYSQQVSYGWSGTATPSKAGYVFSPPSRTYGNVDSDQIDQDYTATVAYINILPQLARFAPQSANISLQKTSATGNLLAEAQSTISGTVKDEQGTGIEGVTITFADASRDGFDNVAVRGNYAYLAGDRLKIIDILDPGSTKEISSYDLRSGPVALSGDYAYLGNLSLVDISDPENPEDAGYYYEGEGAGLAVSGNYAYLPGSLSILKNKLAPQVSIIDPSAWDIVLGSVSIEVLASHSSGINRVEFYINDSYEAADNTSPYTYTWDTTSVAEGSHKIRARAYNNNGKSSDSEIEVSIRTYRNLYIYPTSGGTADPATGTYSYDYGTEVSITAIPDSGYGFSGWTGDVPDGHENDNPVTITMDSDKAITANFIKQYTLTISAGTGGTTDPAPENYPCDEETEVSITAIPDSGYRFNGWTGNVPDGDENENPVTITMDSDKSLTANFSAIATDGDEAGAEKKKGPCFIATAAYSSPLHPHVDVLRDFRDRYLMSSKLGRLLVEFYYRYSPFSANFIAKHKALKVVVRLSLLPLVAFSYLLLHSGPILTAVMLLFILGLPVFPILFFRRKMRQAEATSPKAMASRS